jgi:tetratricopeptide (TPR) repeat protein
MRLLALAIVLACATAWADAGIASDASDAGIASDASDAGIASDASDAGIAGIASEADAEADAALRAAIARSTTDATGALADLEALGARRPLTRWSDNAWSEAARLAEAAGDFTRARRALEQVIAIDLDRVMVQRARATIGRLTAKAGDGTWDAIAREHDRLVSAIFAGGDPHDDLAALEKLVGANPAYPRTVAARTAIARGYEMEGDADIALAWMRRAADAAGPDERGQRTRLELVRMALRTGELDVASREIAHLTTNPATDRAALVDARDDLASAERRRWLRIIASTMLGLLAIAALVRLARDLAVHAPISSADPSSASSARSSPTASSAGASMEGTSASIAEASSASSAGTSPPISSADHASGVSRFAWRAAFRRLVRPPVEVVFMLPLAGLVVAIAAANNPLVARSIATISAAGVAIAWVSGVLVDVAREKRRVSRVRLAIHLACVALAVGGVFFLAVERGVIQLLVETWRGGHAH